MRQAAPPAPPAAAPAGVPPRSSAAGVPAERSAPALPDFREPFIPLRKADLVQLLASEPGLSAAEREEVVRMGRLLSDRFHAEFHAVLEELKDAYAPFDPDCDTHSLRALSPEERSARAENLFERCTWLLERANFRRLSREEIQSAMETASHWGINLRVDFEMFDRLEVFARGETVERRTRRSWRRLRRRVEVEVPVYRRLVVMFHLREAAEPGDEHPDPVYLKIFRNIPKMDVEMLLPGTRLRMTLLDRGKIVVPTVSGGIITAVKVVQTILAAATLSTLAFLAVIGGSFGYGLRSFHGWLRHKQRYQLHLTRSLYYQNLDNNAGVLCRLLDEAEEQECREALLAWYHLWRRAGPEGWRIERLDAAVEEFLAAHLPFRVDFEISDAVSKLHRLGIVERAEGGAWRAARPAEALPA